MKIERINSQLVKEITLIIEREINDPRLINQLFTITSISTTKDLQFSKVRISFRNTQDAETYIEILNKASSYIRKLLFERVNIRVIPQITFEYDKGWEHSMQIDAILQKIHEEKRAKKDV
ncbi:MAG: 30S ribosome-binding factor RbfA [Christensenellales bacterium]|jgi:ribosome-binding factor A|nr:30S ribosome-binding factor RbfA [Clostridiales bacterium]